MLCDQQEEVGGGAKGKQGARGTGGKRSLPSRCEAKAEHEPWPRCDHVARLTLTQMSTR